ncbi:hypothetical protein U8527_00255 [Kordia algicida OT-1]|uniref:Uncharacterized protein n=1 Tax=Kordia algicida OT-1 TaxID=391587 RepID=A9DR02_9FLAO|nr:hypothetical protein [Kordia algicida]EDP96721.1 hypothetical protein KAOT1_16198 [Kordia algicida OT-1]
MNLHYIFYCFFFVASSANGLSTNTSETIRLETSQQEFTAGETIVLTFSGTQDASIVLYCTNSYGTTLVSATAKNNQLQYTIPTQICAKTGIVNWKLLDTKNSLSGTFTIHSQNQPVSMETYVGPPSIAADENDYTMLVVIPTDALDNPVKENTKVALKRQFLATEQQETIQTKNLIAYQNIYAPTKSGRMLLATECLGLNSKEFTVNVLPAISTDFEIYAKRPHEYADGNQITTFTTSILKDENNNIVSDGTFVEFFIENTDGNLLKTSGMTIDGVATAQLLHPDHAETWKVQAFVTGISKSNTISLTYKKVMDDFTISFSKNNRNIKIGPLRSFMNQLIPDGLQVTCIVSQNGKVIESYLKESRDGFVNFELNPNILSNGNYDFEITTAGITKTVKAKKLW